MYADLTIALEIALRIPLNGTRSSSRFALLATAVVEAAFAGADVVVATSLAALGATDAAGAVA
ncbi:hypothetical protein D3C76_1217130 [compost metagenome]